MSSTSLIYKREVSMKDLFNPKNVINTFDVIEIDYESFVNVIGKGLFDINVLKHLKIHINTLAEWKAFETIMSSTRISTKQFIDLIIPQSILKDVGINFDTNKKFNLYIEYEEFVSLNDVVDYSDKFKTWIQNNPIYFKCRLTNKNYIDIITAIGEMYTRGMFRFFSVSFDYTSFQDFKLSDLHKLEFWINTLGSYFHSGSEDKFSLEVDGNFHRRILVKGLKLYYPNSDILLLDLGKNIGNDGETISSDELYMYRRYVDMKARNVLFNMGVTKIPWNLIEWGDNFKINNELIEVPPITCMIIQWLNNVIVTKEVYA